jgi:hypothetical protein
VRKARSACVALTIVLVTSAIVAACGGDDDDSAGSGSGSGSGSASAVVPEDLRAPDAEVAAGLAALKSSFTQTADAVEAGAQMASSLEERLQPAWEKIEGTIKANDPDAYITFEDQLAAMGNAVDDEDAAKARDAAETFGSAADKYLAEHPG